MTAEIASSPTTNGTPDLAGHIRTALQNTLFGSRLIRPRQIEQIAQDVAASFLCYTNGSEGDPNIQAFGRRLASNGLGHASLIAMVAVLHTHTYANGQANTNGVQLSVGYTGSLLTGYMEEREAYLLKEQERSRLALERARMQS